MHPITQQLQNIYNKNAKQFSQTRKKHRPEIDHIVAHINTLPQKSISIIELWCWDGRLYSYITKNTKKTIKYTGVDISDKLLEIGKANNTKATFICSDMVDYIQKGKQESVDIVISIAAFHHLVDKKQRLLVLKNIYRLLKYDGAFVMTNRCFSTWFIKKYRQAIIRSMVRYLLTLWHKDRKDVYIPRNKKDLRYYHIFNKKDIEKLATISWFIIRENCYIQTNGEKSIEKENARNIFTILQKNIRKDYSSYSS